MNHAPAGIVTVDGSEELSRPALSVMPQLWPTVLFGNFVWILIGNAASAGAQFTIVAILARFRGAAVLGAYSLGMSLAAVVSAATSLDLRTLQVTDSAEQTPFAVYYLLRLWMSIASFGLLSVLTLFLHSSPEARVAVVAMAFTKGVDGLSDIIYGRLQLRLAIVPIAKSQLARSGLFLLIPGLMLGLLAKPVWAIWSMIVPSAAVFLLYDLPNVRSFGATSAPKCGIGSTRACRLKLQSLAKVGLPLTVLTTLVLLHLSIPRFVVARTLGEADTGVVTALAYIAIAPNMVVVALGQAGMALLARTFSAGHQRLFVEAVLRVAAAAMGLGVLVLVGGITFGGPMLVALYGPGFARYHGELVLFLVAGCVSYLNTAVGYALSSARAFRIQVRIMAAVCGISLLTSIVLVSSLGVTGAAISQIISVLTQLILSIVALTQTVTTARRVNAKSEL